MMFWVEVGHGTSEYGKLWARIDRSGAGALYHSAAKLALIAHVVECLVGNVETGNCSLRCARVEHCN
jgi:hypothetical protein